MIPAKFKTAKFKPINPYNKNNPKRMNINPKDKTDTILIIDRRKSINPYDKWERKHRKYAVHYDEIYQHFPNKKKAEHFAKEELPFISYNPITFVLQKGNKRLWNDLRIKYITM